MKNAFCSWTERYRHNTIEVFFSKKETHKIPYYRDQPWAVSLFLCNCNHQNNQTRTEEKIEKNAKRDRRTEWRVEEKKRGKKQGWYEENEARGGGRKKRWVKKLDRKEEGKIEEKRGCWGWRRKAEEKLRIKVVGKKEWGKKERENGEMKEA